MNVHKKLMIARLKLQQLPLKKSGHNKFAGYQYFELGDFLPSVQDLFGEVGLCGTVSFGTDIAKLTVTNIDDPTQSIEFTSPMSSAALKGCHEVQNLGAVQTYLRRYLWVAAMEIVEHDSVDAVTGKDEPKKADPTSEAQRIVGVPKDRGRDRFNMIMDAPAYDDNDAISWLNVVQESAENFLGYCKKPDDVMDLFKRNKVLFDKFKSVDAETFTLLMQKFTARKTQLEKETTDGH